MKRAYTNSITKFFDDYNGFNHYMFYGEEDIKNKELPIRVAGGLTVGSVCLNNSGKIFSINVDTCLTVKYSEHFEKTINDKFMDAEYDFSKDTKE